jgi:primosomal protein N' (replication factor Y)
MPTPIILTVALPTPLRRLFDYLAPADADTPAPGCRVQVPFGNRTLIGIVVNVGANSDIPAGQLKPALAVLDREPIINAELSALCQWTARYYHHALGEVYATALPVLLRQGEPAQLQTEPHWQLTAAGRSADPEQLRRAPKQRAALLQLQTPVGASPASRATLLALQDKGLVELTEIIPTPPANPTPAAHLALNAEQAVALAAIDDRHFGTWMLEGATGSGKTEVYLQAIARVLERGRQALVLVPEIGLTPQTIDRFRQRFGVPVIALHSGLNDRERLQAWLQAAAGSARIIIGTRSAIWIPAADLGIIIIDEEHDLSFKQQDGLRYSARDLAVVRARRRNIPLLLGSATPSLETLHNCRQQRYHHLFLHRRAGNASAPPLALQDIRRQPLTEGFSSATLSAIGEELRAGNQVLVFINRRGFAPTLMCTDCGWLAQCPHCDARLTVHQHPRHLHCHHCDHQRPLPRQCPECRSHQLNAVGLGTERSEIALQQLFPGQRIIRVDRDTTRRKDAMATIIGDIHSGEPCILVGTQMLAKGHHFPDVTLVVVLDADGGLFSADFRGAERCGQLLLQVAGRAGRADKPGRVIIQTLLPDHPWLQTLIQQGYSAFAELLLYERELAGLPPYRYMALLRAEAGHAQLALQLLQEARQLAHELHPPSPELGYLGPLPAPLEKRNQRFRYQLQIHASNRARLHELLAQLTARLETLPAARRCRWSLDVDPLDLS